MTGADLVLLATEWPEYTSLDANALGKLTRGRTIIDARNALNPATWEAAGSTYRGLGRRGTGLASSTPPDTGAVAVARHSSAAPGSRWVVALGVGGPPGSRTYLAIMPYVARSTAESRCGGASVWTQVL